MMSVDTAKKIISVHGKKRKAINVVLSEALGLIAAEALKAKCSSPSFFQSAMDGYAFSSGDKSAEITLDTIEIPAGNTQSITLKKRHAVRIFTGAKMPINADTVVPQEFVEERWGKLFFDRKSFSKNANVRAPGSHFCKGELILKKGEKLSPLRLSLAAAAGISKIKCYAKPSVSIVINGNELIAPGEKLKQGQVYESNSILLSLLLKETGYTVNEIMSCGDDEKLMKKTLEKASKKSDVILLSGGISVGKYDFSVKVFDSINVRKLFYKVAQKPGKPLFFGKSDKKYFFGLPGNPAASLTCFYEYVFPFLKSLSGDAHAFPVSVKGILKNNYSKKVGLTHFLKAKYVNGEVEILDHQESYKITSFGAANCLLVVPEKKELLMKGDEATCHLLYNNMI